MRISFIQLFLFLVSLNIYAGDSKGYGGDILSCQEFSPYHNTPLDYYETYEKFGWHIETDSFQGLDEISIVSKVLENFKSLDSHRYVTMKKNLQTFYNDVKWINFPLINIDDAGFYNLPPSCKLIQIINQNKKILLGKKKYLIRKDLWLNINKLSKAVLILHEILYLESEGKNSELIRELVARAFTNRITFYYPKNYIFFLKRAGFKTFTYNGVNFIFNKDLKFYSNGNLKHGDPVKGSIMYLENKSIVLTHDEVEFYSTGELKSFCSRKGLDIKIFDQSLKSSCANYYGHYQPTLLFKNGRIKQTTILTGTINSENRIYNFGNNNQSGSYFSVVNFNQNNSLRSLEHVKLDLKLPNKENIYFSPYDPIFFDGLSLKKATINTRQIVTINNNPVFISGETTFSANQIESTYLAVQTSFTIGINTIIAKPKSKITMHPNLKLRSLILAKDQLLIKINGQQKIYKKETKVFLDQNGNIL